MVEALSTRKKGATMKQKSDVKVGDMIHIYIMFADTNYTGCDGIVKYIDYKKQILYGSWGEAPLHFDDDWVIVTF